MRIHDMVSAGPEIDPYTGKTQNEQSAPLAGANHNTTTGLGAAIVQCAWFAHSAAVLHNKAASRIIVTNAAVYLARRDFERQDVEAALILVSMSKGGSRNGGTA
ncbi:hypothetical protein J3459_015237 [Metarhizium acridum]|nr:hypothetical protein J3459_015237 [Metarhizium acridum]